MVPGSSGTDRGECRRARVSPRFLIPGVHPRWLPPRQGSQPITFTPFTACTAYREILLEQRLGRRRFPAPHPSLTRMEEVLLRQLHTNTLPIPATLHKYYPDIYPTPQCPHCDQTGDLLHTMWHCTQNPNMKNITPNNRSTTQWEATLLNPHPACQKWLADRAERATRRPLAAPD